MTNSRCDKKGVTRWARDNPGMFQGVVLILLSGLFTGVVVVLHHDIKESIARETKERNTDIERVKNELKEKTEKLTDKMSTEIGKLQSAYERHRIDMRDMSQQMVRVETTMKLMVLPTLEEIKRDVKSLDKHNRVGYIPEDGNGDG